MQARQMGYVGMLLVALLAVPSATLGQTPVGTAFTYQGQLKKAGTPVNNTADFQFSLWDAEIGGLQVGSTIAVNNVDVDHGLFTVVLDFGENIFTGQARWLQIAVRSPGGGGNFTTLSPPQNLAATPYALYSAAPWATSGDGIFYNAGKVGIGWWLVVGDDLDSNPLVPSIIVGDDNPNGGAFIMIGASGAGDNLHLGWDRDDFGRIQAGTGLDGNPRALILQPSPLDGPVGIHTDTPTSPLTVAGMVESTADGFKFPDGSVQTSAAFGASGSTGARTPLQIALLRWYEANQAGVVFYTGGTYPVDVAFDGENIWVSNLASNDVGKLRASDGWLLGTYSVGTQPCGLAFDGRYMWVALKGENKVKRFRPSNPSGEQFTYTVGMQPSAVAFDGANVWVTNGGSNSATKLRASDGAPLGTYNVGSVPWSVAFDGASIWVTNNGDDTVTKLRASDGQLLGTYAVGDGPQGVAFDGANIWIANSGSSTVTKLRASDGAELGTYSVGANPTGVVFDGTNIWVANYTSRNVTKLRASDGMVLGTFPVNGYPQGMAFDGANIWVANFIDGGVSKL